MFSPTLLATLAFLTSGHLPLSTASTDPHVDHFQQFIRNVEALVMNTTDRALIVTKSVYLNLKRTMPTDLYEATEKLLHNYIRKVDEALEEHADYKEKRKLLQLFRANNRRIEQLRKQSAPQNAEFQFPLISQEFYNTGNNRTEFDNLYLEFIKSFDDESKQLWATLSEQTVEEQEELLEIIDEISKERQLREKDKLYDEFIEMFLFKGDWDRVENRELE